MDPGFRACNQIGAGVPSLLFHRSRESGNLGISVTCPWTPAFAGVTIMFGKEPWGSEIAQGRQTLEGREVADHDRPLAEIDPARLVPGLEMLVDALPAAAGDV